MNSSANAIGSVILTGAMLMPAHEPMHDAGGQEHAPEEIASPPVILHAEREQAPRKSRIVDEDYFLEYLMRPMRR